MVKKEPLDVFRDFLKTKQLNLTKERIVILNKIYSIKNHFNVEELFHKLRIDGEAVSLASVYRTLNLLVESNLVEKVDFGEGRAYYEPALDRIHHDHLICTGCGKVVQFEDPIIESQQEKLCRKHDFELDYHTLNIFGNCPNCRDKK